MNYFRIIENGEEKYLKTEVSQNVLSLMTKDYLLIKDRSKLSFQKYLDVNGIKSIYDNTISTINLDQSRDNY